MKRKRADETVERFRRRQVEAAATEIRSQLIGSSLGSASAADFANDPAKTLVGLEDLDDRAQDSWEPLLLLADLAGDGWSSRARTAALTLSGGRDSGGSSLGTRLLSDIREVLEEIAASEATSEQLIEMLVRIDDAPWGDWYGKPITSRRLADMLAPFGVKPTRRRDWRGYQRSAFADAWARYLPSSRPSTRHTRHSGSTIPTAADWEPSSPQPTVTGSGDPDPHDQAPVTVMTGFPSDEVVCSQEGSVRIDASSSPRQAATQRLAEWESAGKSKERSL